MKDKRNSSVASSGKPSALLIAAAQLCALLLSPVGRLLFRDWMCLQRASGSQKGSEQHASCGAASL
jgi:hypothetical protein